MRLDLSSLDSFFERTSWPLGVGCNRCFPDIDLVSCDDIAAVRSWIEAHADLPHDVDGMDLLLMPPFRQLPDDFFGPGIGSPL